MAGTTRLSNSQDPMANLEAAVHTAEVSRASAAQTDLWIFRDGRRLVSGPETLRDLASRISASATGGQQLADALIQAGEIEAALADSNSSAASLAAQLTDLLAMSVCDGSPRIAEAAELASQIESPDQLNISPPEGFTYYALHPLDFASVISQISDEPTRCALIGIRSIGTTLSAMCAAALKQKGRPISRITVRPTGHPYDRKTDFTTQQSAWIRQQLVASAQFLIVDEGPGRSGSTFLSVAEALIGAGVPNQRITIIGSRQPEPDSLCANHAAARWSSFRFIATAPSVNKRFEKCAYIASGNWRELVFTTPSKWPESWTQMERLKFLSPDRQSLFKFEGMGPLGAQVRNRAFVVADAGFSPKVSDAGNGFLDYKFAEGRPMQVQDLSSSMLDDMAAYCAFRAAHFPMQQSDPSELRRMLEYNLQQEFGLETSLPADALLTAQPVLADGRMQPYEWILAKSRFVKTDAISHGDDHFFPGPCDIAWDLAGIAIEWQLDAPARDYLLTQYRRLSETDAGRQLPLYMLAYSVFRLGFCKMAISTVRGSAEEQRLALAYNHYRSVAKALLQRSSEVDSPSSHAA